MKKNLKIKNSVILYAILILIVVFLVVIGALLYGFDIENKLVEKTARIFPYPAVIFSNGRFISYNEIQSKLNSIKNFYTSQDFSEEGLRVDFSTEDGKKRLKIKEKDLINKLIEDRFIEKTANAKGIKITDEMVAQEVNRKLDEYGNRDYLKNTLFKLYGWQIDDFEKNIVKPDLYKEKLKESVIQNDEGFLKARKIMEKAQEEMKNGQSFEETAKKHSEGESARDGGGLGWFSYDQITPEVGAVIYMMEKGETSDIIQSSLGYHIVNLEDKKTEDNLDQVKIKQIFVRTESFGSWLEKQMKDMKIYIPLKDFEWDKNSGLVDFSSEVMRKFEEKEYSQPSGDASTLF